MSDEKLEKSAPKTPSLKVSLPIELFNRRLRRLEEQSTLPISCNEVTSTSGDYYGAHGGRIRWDQAIPKGNADSTNLNTVEGNNLTQQKIPDGSEQPKHKEEHGE